MSTPSLVAADYIVAVIILLVPVGIGVLYAVKDANKATRTEYLLGGRKMAALPVAMSIFVSFMSAISMIGVPAETYFYGAVFALAYVGYSLSYIFGCFTVVPLMYPLKLTSVYEYIKHRYESEVVYLICAVVGMVITVCYMSIALLSPALALEASAGLPLWMSIAVIGAVGTLYTAIGGIKSVIWTDVFQSVVMYIGLIVIIVKVCVSLGGLGEVLRLSRDGGRLNFDRYSLDPTVRHTIWSLLIGCFWMWVSNFFNQTIVQRIRSNKSLLQAKLCFIYNIPLVLIYCLVIQLTGLSIYAYYTKVRCGPFEADLISNRNQIAPYFVLHVMEGIPGMAGLFIGALCCGSLSTLSSGVNSLAANTVQDILKRPLTSLKESTITLITKLISVVFGVIIVALTYLAKSAKGNVNQLAITVFGSFGSPILGIFMMGASVPWANKYGAIVGALVSLVFNLWVSIGSKIYGGDPTPLSPVPTDQCFTNSTSSLLAQDMNMTILPAINFMNNSSENVSEMTFVYYTSNSTVDSTNATTPKPSVFFMYEISYEWYSFMGLVVCVIVGLMVSYVTEHTLGRRIGRQHTKAEHIFPCLRPFWGLKVDINENCTDAELEPLDKHKEAY